MKNKKEIIKTLQMLKVKQDKRKRNRLKNEF